MSLLAWSQPLRNTTFANICSSLSSSTLRQLSSFHSSWGDLCWATGRLQSLSTAAPSADDVAPSASNDSAATSSATSKASGLTGILGRPQAAPRAPGATAPSAASTATLSAVPLPLPSEDDSPDVKPEEEPEAGSGLPSGPLPADGVDGASGGPLDGPPPAPRLLQVIPTPEGPQPDKLLVRDFIQNSLYHPTRGYFSQPTPPVGSVGPSPINYWKIYCRDEYNLVVNKKYKELETSFLTPAELFSPAYGACVARHIVEHRRHHLGLEGQPLEIVEVGGGNGTLARDVLDWLRANRPEEYRRTTYTCLEISSSLAARQYDKVVRQGGHGGAFRLRRGSGLDRGVWGSRSWTHTFVLMMEVLDNLPHDRVLRRSPSEPWQQTSIVLASDSPHQQQPTSSTSPSSPSSPPAAASSPLPYELGPWREQYEPLSDPLVCRTLAAAHRPASREELLDERFNRVLDFILARDAQPSAREEVVWLPTACCAFLELLHDLRPNHSLMAADFDRLPDVRLPGRNAPLVAEKVGGRNIDHNTLFVPWGTADIFFPTDFDALCRLYKAAAEHVWGPGGTGYGSGTNNTAASTSTGGTSATGAGQGGGSGQGQHGAGSGSAETAAQQQPEGQGQGQGHRSAAVAVGEGDGGVGGEVVAEHFRQGAVMKRYREMATTATICAFNPMVDDFVNARFFFGDSRGRLPPGTPRPDAQAAAGKARKPTGVPSAATSGIKAHIPAAPAAKAQALKQQRQGQAAGSGADPVLGGRKRRADAGAGGVGGGSGTGAGAGLGGSRGRGR